MLASNMPTLTTSVTKWRLKGVVERYMSSEKFPTHAHPSFQAFSIAANGPGPSADLAIDRRQLQQHDVASTQALVDHTPAGEKDDIPLDEIYRDADSWKSSFEAAMREYERKAPDTAKTRIMIGSQHTWEEAFDTVTKELGSYKDPPGWFGRVRKTMRSLGNNKDLALAWANLLPTQSEYFSILCGGLKLVITAAARLGSICDELATALEKLPRMLTWTHGTLSIFKSSKDLHICSANFYVSLIASLNVMVDYLRQKSLVRFGSSLFLGDSFGKKVDEAIEQVQTRSEQFKECAQRCAYASIEDTRRTAKAQLIESRQAHWETVYGFEQVKLGQRQLQDLNLAEFQGLRGQVQRIEESQQQFHTHLETNFSAIHSAIWQSVNMFLASDKRIDLETHNLRPESIGLQRSLSDPDRCRKRSLATRKSLLEVLHYEDVAMLNDIEKNLRLATDVRLRASDRVQALMRNPKMKTWITQASSGALFVNGNHCQSIRQPPTSYVSAKLVKAVRSVTSADSRSKVCNIVLSFFCAEHKNLKDPDAGPDGMMRSLLAQLLSAYRDFDLITVGRMKDVNYEDVDDLGQIFQSLVEQLPQHIVVFCALDAITFHEEREAWKEDARTAVQRIARFAESAGDQKCVFKLLLTSPIKSRLLHRCFPEKSVIWMPDRVPVAGRVTERYWAESVTLKVSSHLDDKDKTPEDSSMQVLRHDIDSE